MTTIQKKVWREYFGKIVSGKKKQELRLADFEVNEGDTLVLEEWDKDKKEYTGRKVEVVATYILKTKGQPFWPPEEVEKYGFQIIQFETKAPADTDKIISGPELVVRANQFQQEAKRILDKLGLMKILKEISEPKVVGSATNGLMVAKDIDIHAYVEEYDVQEVVNLLPRLALLPTIQRVQFNNYRELRRDYRKDRINFPHAYYVGLRTLQPSGEWKIDMWFAKEGGVDEFNDPRLQNLSGKQRETILKLKESWYTKNGYRDGVVSVDFYKAALDFRVKTNQDFEHYLRTKESKESR